MPCDGCSPLLCPLGQCQLGAASTRARAALSRAPPATHPHHQAVLVVPKAASSDAERAVAQAAAELKAEYGQLEQVG